MADSRQIIWRESLRSLYKHSIRAQTVLPHMALCASCKAQSQEKGEHDSTNAFPLPRS